MIKKIKIGNKTVEFTANAATPRKYRNAFPGHDIMTEMMSEEANYEAMENLAYIMSGAEEPIEDWLAQFEITDLYEALAEVFGMWIESQEGNLKPSKKDKAADL